jgi:hypothetical protein
LVLAGRNEIVFSAITLSDVRFTPGENGEDPYVFIRVLHEPAFFDNLHLQADMEIVKSLVSFSGESSISGGIVSLAGTVTIDGQLTAGGPIVMTSEEPYAPIIGFHGDATIVAPLLHIQQLTQLYNNGHSTFFGNLQNDGNISIVGTDTLTIIGNYNQSVDGHLILSEIDPLIDFTGYINVSGKATINGFVAYSVKSALDKHVKLPILFASEGIHGKFELKSDESGNTRARLEYTESTLYFVYEPKHKFLGLDWWSWALIAAAGGFVFAFLIPCVYYRTRVRGRYESITEELSPPSS